MPPTGTPAPYRPINAPPGFGANPPRAIFPGMSAPGMGTDGATPDLNNLQALLAMSQMGALR